MGIDYFLHRRPAPALPPHLTRSKRTHTHTT